MCYKIYCLIVCPLKRMNCGWLAYKNYGLSCVHTSYLDRIEIGNSRAVESSLHWWFLLFYGTHIFIFFAPFYINLLIPKWRCCHYDNCKLSWCVFQWFPSILCFCCCLHLLHIIARVVIYNNEKASLKCSFSFQLIPIIRSCIHVHMHLYAQ